MENTSKHRDLGGVLIVVARKGGGGAVVPCRTLSHNPVSGNPT